MKILWKRGGAISPLFHNIFHLLLDLHVYAGTRFSLRDKQLLEISEVKITSLLYLYVHICFSEYHSFTLVRLNFNLHRLSLPCRLVGNKYRTPQSSFLSSF